MSDERRWVLAGPPFVIIGPSFPFSDEVEVVPASRLAEVEAELRVARWDANVARGECDMAIAAATMELRQRAERAEARLAGVEAQAERLRNGLADLADLHHRTVAGSKKHDPEHVTNFRDCPCKPCQRAAALLDGRETGPERAWAIAERAEAERDRLRSECAVCEKCGHVQAEPNWCHECGHRTTPPVWAKPLLDAFFERNDLAERAERAEAALRTLLAFGETLLASDNEDERGIGWCICEGARIVASVPSSLDAPKRELPCGLCHGYGAANEATHEPVPCLACGKKSEGMILIALDPPRHEPPPDSQRLGLRLVDAPKENDRG